MTKELFSPIIKALTAATILLVLISANSMMNYTYATTKNTPIQNVTNQYAALPGSTTFLNVVTKVDNTNGGTKQPSDFTITVSGNRPSRPNLLGNRSRKEKNLLSCSCSDSRIFTRTPPLFCVVEKQAPLEVAKEVEFGYSDLSQL